MDPDTNESSELYKSLLAEKVKILEEDGENLAASEEGKTKKRKISTSLLQVHISFYADACGANV